MKKHLPLLAAALFAVLSTTAYSMNQADASPSTWPNICQQYLKRADACFAQAGDKAAFQRDNTKYLIQFLTRAPEAQRKQMCQLAMDTFKEKTQNLGCE